MHDDNHFALLRGDAAEARRLALAELPRSSGSRQHQLLAAQVFAAVLDGDFSTASALALALPVNDDALLIAVRALAASMQETIPGPTPKDAVDAALEDGAPLDERSLWAVCLAAEAAMSAGRLDLAERAAVAAWTSPAARTGPSSVFAGQCLIRVLLFTGRLGEAKDLGPAVLARARAFELPALGLVAASALAYVAVLRGERGVLDSCVTEVEATAPSCPPSYFVGGALVLASYALAADGRAESSCEMLLRAGGGPDLPRVQLVDRAYGYELLVTAALSVGDLAAARGWAGRALRLEVRGDSMAEAALRRTRARLAAAEGDGTAGSALASQARDLAAANAGRLDAARAALLSGSVLLADASSAVAAREALNQAGDQARDLGAVSLAVLARRDLRSIGLRPSATQPAQLSSRELEVAELVIAGLTNGQIARALGISERTVHTHVRSVLQALGLSSRTGVGTALAAGTETAPRSALTVRQAQVADLVVRGYTNDGVARALAVSVKTVEKHVGDAFRKLGVDSRTALASRWSATDSVG